MCLYKSKNEIEEKTRFNVGDHDNDDNEFINLYSMHMYTLLSSLFAKKFSFFESLKRDREKITTNLLTYYLFPISM